MPEESLVQMHSDFPRWYREVDLEEKREESRERLRARWTGVDALLAKLDRKDVRHLLHVVFRDKRGLPEDFFVRFRQAFKDADDLFDMQGNDREIEILAGSLLAACMEVDDDQAAWAALAVSTCMFGGVRKVHLPIDLGSIAEKAIARIAERHRKRPSLDNMKIAPPTFDFSKAKEELVSLDSSTLGAAFDQTATTMTSVISNIAKQFNTSLESVTSFLTIQDEELNMLWWVVGERSDGTKQSFLETPNPALPIVCGFDLAAYTVYLPGPQSVRGLLIKAGLSASDNLTIPETINACQKPLLESIVESDETSSLIQPMHFAIQRKLETGDNESWVAGWAAKTGIDASAKLHSEDLGVLFYRERLLSLF